jgi:hypothetical protein
MMQLLVWHLLLLLLLCCQPCGSREAASQGHTVHLRPMLLYQLLKLIYSAAATQAADYILLEFPSMVCLLLLLLLLL